MNYERIKRISIEIALIIFFCSVAYTRLGTLSSLDKEGEVIAELYAAGEIVGWFNGANSPSGMESTPCFVSGRIAGKNAAVI